MMPVVDSSYLQRVKEDMAQKVQRAGGAQGWASDNNIALEDAVATCQRIAREAIDLEYGLGTMLMVAFQVGYETRSAQATREHSSELCHRHGACGPEGDCFICDKELAQGVSAVYEQALRDVNFHLGLEKAGPADEPTVAEIRRVLEGAREQARKITEGET